MLPPDKRSARAQSVGHVWRNTLPPEHTVTGQ